MAKQTILTKEDFEKGLKNLNKDLKTHVTKEIAELAGIQAREFDRVHQKLDKLTSATDNHEKRIKRIERAVGMPEAI